MPACSNLSHLQSSSCKISVNIRVLTWEGCVHLNCADHAEFHWLPESRLPGLINQEVLQKELLLILIKLWKLFIGFLTLYPRLIFKWPSLLLIFLHIEMFLSFNSIITEPSSYKSLSYNIVRWIRECTHTLVSNFLVLGHLFHNHFHYFEVCFWSVVLYYPN